VKYIILLFLLLTGCTNQNLFLVKEVIDGDTLILASGEHVRLLAVDTPEKGECYYQESKDFLTSLVKDRLVSLEKDKTNKDSYGRLLRYVYSEKKLVNSILVEKGYAEAFNRYISTTSKYQEMKKLEIKAKKAKIGRWNCS